MPACTSIDATSATTSAARDTDCASKSRALPGITGRVLLAATASARQRSSSNVPLLVFALPLDLFIAVKLLSISTSTSRGSAAVLDGERALASVDYSDPHGHAERLFAAIDDALREAGSGTTRASIDAIACDIGPGSFTGVRVAVASAKGIALALGLPTIGVTSLEAIAAAAFGGGRAKPGDVAAAVIDAKKGELFVAAYDNNLKTLLEPIHVPRGSIQDALRPLAGAARAPGRLVLVGELGDLASPGDEASLPDAVWIGRIAAARLVADPKATLDAADLEALYVRAPDAKLPG